MDRWNLGIMKALSAFSTVCSPLYNRYLDGQRSGSLLQSSYNTRDKKSYANIAKSKEPTVETS
jgi:hypothetical protein